MKKRAVRVVGSCLGLFLLWSAAGAASIVMPLAQVKAGMKGKGRSVFAGTKIDDFDVEVLGVMANAQPKRNVIIARFSGQGLETTGVVSGMSGSPVYIDGKLVGAVAFSFPYAKQAIGGITPIEEMMGIDRTPAAPPAGGAPGLPIRSSMSLEDLSEAYRNVFAAKRSEYAAGQPVSPLMVPLVFGGFSPWAFEHARPFFETMGFRAVQGGNFGAVGQAAPAAANATLQEGDAVGVQLIGGDLELSAVGTVTYVDGTKILAFGHPLYNLGGVEYAMTRANVITVVPSLESSFKVAATGPVIGRFTQDRTAGVSGEVGKLADTIPVNITVQRSPSERREFKLKLADDKFLTPALLNMSVSSLITAEERTYGNLSLEFAGDIFLDKGMSIHVEDLFSGNYDTAATSLSGLLAAVVYYLNNNEFKDVGIFRIDLNVRTAEEAKICTLDRVLLDKYEVAPGEKIQITAFLRTLKEETLVEDVTLLTPPLPAGSEFQIVIGDAASMQQVERSQYRTPDLVPRNLAQLVRLLGNLRKNNRIYFKILASKPGLFLRGEEMPNLPPTFKTMLASPRASSSGATELARSTLTEYQLPLPYVFKGGAVIPVKIRK